MGLDILENERISEKRCFEIENWGFSVYFGFKKIQFTVKLYTYVVANILQNGAKLRYAKAGWKNYRKP